MGTEINATVTLQGNTVLKGKAHTDHEVWIDYIPPLGNDDGFMPLELLLVSLSACSCHTVLFLLRKMGKAVEDMEVRAIGERQDDHPTVFTSIELQFNLKGNNLDAPAVEKAIKMSEETYCPVWAMLKNSTALSSKYMLN
jgi:putative redox protein